MDSGEFLAPGTQQLQMHATNLLFWAMLLIALLYLLVSVRDTAGDLRFIFERRLVRRYLARFSLRTLLCVTPITALFFALVQQFQVPPGDWLFLAMAFGFLAGTAQLMWVAWKDIRFRGSARSYPDRYDREIKAQDAPPIRK